MSLTYGILLLAVCTVFVSMPHGTLSSKCSKSSVAPICGVGCNWGAWTGWVSEGTCNVTCGNGSQVQYRNRTCIPQTVGKQCNATSSECQSIPCNTQSCTVDGGWNVWNSWTSDGNCFTTCSVCAQPQTRYRECTRPVPQNGGNYCSGSSTESKNISCDVITCPLVNGGWGEWRNWTESSSCSTSCGGGTMTIVRTRFCINPPPENGGKHCNGTMSQSLNVPCNTEPCSPVNASWGDWTPWTSNGRWNFTCTTGSQTQTRSRPCSIPQSCGFNCDGDATFSQILQCNKETCPPAGHTLHTVLTRKHTRWNSNISALGTK
ncbi:hypothetical protein ACJMK2_015762 [Sinanodonta woodiana]|uniref:Uncharacterized protein n=1 Tax=Sinanodonta woodiana TaxID=1069815 RepID=A0ABD3USN8_SINWO